MTELPFSEACERNKDPILEKLRVHFAGATRVLEIGSGTGQHALHFAAALPQLVWQTSEVPGQDEAVRARLAAHPLPNVRAPLALDVRGAWPAGPFDAIFSANTLHIMGWDGVSALFSGVGQCLASGGVLAIYGPFNGGGGLDGGGELAGAAGLEPVADHAMPANNRLLVWVRAP